MTGVPFKEKCLDQRVCILLGRIDSHSVFIDIFCWISQKDYYNNNDVIDEISSYLKENIIPDHDRRIVRKILKAYKEEEKSLINF
jgi:hypothetical protein